MHEHDTSQRPAAASLGEAQTSLNTQYAHGKADFIAKLQMALKEANDRMFVVLDRFFKGDITDEALIHSLSALKLSKQYVALTEKACKQIEIVEERVLTEADREKLRTESEDNRVSR